MNDSAHMKGGVQCWFLTRIASPFLVTAGPRDREDSTYCPLHLVWESWVSSLRRLLNWNWAQGRWMLVSLPHISLSTFASPLSPLLDSAFARSLLHQKMSVLWPKRKIEWIVAFGCWVGRWKQCLKILCYSVWKILAFPYTQMVLYSFGNWVAFRVSLAALSRT